MIAVLNKAKSECGIKAMSIYETLWKSNLKNKYQDGVAGRSVEVILLCIYLFVVS